ncbi:MAG: ABC transporter permease [Desulfosporosinus sp.]
MSDKIISKSGERFRAIFWGFTAIIGFLILWQVLVISTDIGKLIPAPIEVLKFFFKSIYKPVGKYPIQIHALVSLRRVMVGYMLGIVLGTTAGIAMGVSKIFSAIFKPIFEMLRPIPTIAWIPLSILWFGVGELSKYFIIFISTFVILTLNSFAGVKQTDPILVGAAKMLGAKDSQIFSKVILPSCVPNIFAGMQTALSASWMSVIAAEMIKSSEGVGWMITAGQETANTVQILAGMVAIAVMGYLMATIMRMAEGRLLAWNVRKT